MVALQASLVLHFVGAIVLTIVSSVSLWVFQQADWFNDDTNSYPRDWVGYDEGA